MQLLRNLGIATDPSVLSLDGLRLKSRQGFMAAEGKGVFAMFSESSATIKVWITRMQAQPFWKQPQNL